jgi:hypothetical protein
MVSMYSPLDKTIAIIHPRGHKGFIVFILNCQSLETAMDWYEFIRRSLTRGERHSTMMVRVPDLDGLQIQVSTCAVNVEGEEHVEEEGDEVVLAGEVINRCMGELRKHGRYTDVLDYWERTYKMGLCWKRYDRLEWVYSPTIQNQSSLPLSWSLAAVPPLPPPPLTGRPTPWNSVPKPTTRPNSVSPSKNISLNLCR